LSLGTAFKDMFEDEKTYWGHQSDREGLAEEEAGMCPASTVQ
jgi:hypothetical protein